MECLARRGRRFCKEDIKEAGEELGRTTGWCGIMEAKGSGRKEGKAG